MPKKGDKFEIRGVLPTEEELNVARLILESMNHKERRAKNAQFAHWCKSTKEEDLSDSRGQSREAWLQRFVVHGMRLADAEKKTTGTRLESASTTNRNDVVTMGMEEMDSTLGPLQAKALRESEKFKSEPCPTTGSNEEHMKVYHVPRNLIRRDGTKSHGVATTITTEASEVDMGIIENALSEIGEKQGEVASGSGAGSQARVPIKDENAASAAAVACAWELKIVNEPRGLYNTFNGYLLESKTISVQLAGAHRYTKELDDDNKKNVVRLEKLVKICERLIVEQASEKSRPALAVALAKSEASHGTVIDWCNKLGIKVQREKAAKRRKTIQ